LGVRVVGVTMVFLGVTQKMAKLRSLGIRVEPECVFWAVVEGDVGVPILIADDKVPSPASADEAHCLVTQRRRILDVIENYHPSVAVIRYPEAIAKTKSQMRSRIEGVLLEAAASKNLKTLTGALATLGSKIGSDAKRAKAMLESENNLRGLDWSKKNSNMREAILAATCGLAVGT
jgi:hypothetical protein